MAILNRFLYLLKLLEDVGDFGAFLNTPAGTTSIFCLLSYQAFTLMSCDTINAAILASIAALTVFCTVNRPTD